MGCSNTKYLCRLLEHQDKDTYIRFIRANNIQNIGEITPLDNGVFTFIFPYEFKFRYSVSLNTIPIQLQILLNSFDCPFNKNLNVAEYYDKIFSSDINIKIRFDLSKTIFIGDLELLMLHTFGYFCNKLTNQKVLTKFNKEKLRFLNRWNFFEYYDEWGIRGKDIKDIPLSSFTKDTEQLIPIKKISDISDVDDTVEDILTEKIITLLEKQYGMSKGLIHDFGTDVVSEICQNIPQHSEDEGFIMVHAHQQEIYLFSLNARYKQLLRNGKVHHEIIRIFRKNRYPLSTDAEVSVNTNERNWEIIDKENQYKVQQPFGIEKHLKMPLKFYKISNRIPNIELAITDGGIGIRQSLYSRYPDYYKNKKHYHAIKEVLRGEFIKPLNQHNGGILRARNYVDALGGTIIIRSICAKASNRQYKYTDVDEKWKFFPGTQVSILIPRYSVRKLKDVS